MADRNSTFYLGGMALDVTGQNPREVRDAARNLVRVVELALSSERADETKMFGSEDRDAMIGALVAARTIISASEELEAVRPRIVA